MTISRSAFLAGVVATALVGVVGQASAQSKPAREKCYGISLAGHNDCSAGPGTSCAGTSKVNHEGDAWKLVPKGTCTTIKSPTSPTGFGQLSAFKEVRR
ncbi:MAG: DUF2282 domain-containing protein [Sphingopyxis sp.]|nr:DUF2282 domain-containing protein [Sphingopyxis sp.]